MRASHGASSHAGNRRLGRGRERALRARGHVRPRGRGGGAGLPPTPRPGIVGGRLAPADRSRRHAPRSHRRGVLGRCSWWGSGSKPATRPVRAGRRLLCATCIRKSDHAADAYPLELDRPRGFDVYAPLSVDPEPAIPTFRSALPTNSISLTWAAFSGSAIPALLGGPVVSHDATRSALRTALATWSNTWPALNELP